MNCFFRCTVLREAYLAFWYTHSQGLGLLNFILCLDLIKSKDICEKQMLCGCLLCMWNSWESYGWSNEAQTLLNTLHGPSKEYGNQVQSVINLFFVDQKLTKFSKKKKYFKMMLLYYISGCKSKQNSGIRLSLTKTNTVWPEPFPLSLPFNFCDSRLLSHFCVISLIL